MATPNEQDRSSGAGWEVVIPLRRETLTAVTTTAALVAHAVGVVSGAGAGLLVLAVVTTAIAVSTVTIRRRSGRS